MSDVANERISAEDFREDNTRFVSPPAVAIDPGTTTGVAVCFADGEVKTRTSSFWGVMHTVGETTDMQIMQMQGVTYIVEAPYLTKWGKAQDNSGMAYNSGGVAREGELLVEGLNRRGYDVVEHDPHSSGNSDWTSGKWGHETAVQIVGEWEGPSNEHVRDCLKMLFIYNVI